MDGRIGGDPWQAIFDAARDAIVAIDGAARIVAFNRAAEGLFGRARTEVLGQPVALLMDWPPEEVERGDVVVRRGDGEACVAEASFSRAGEGEASVRTAILRDATKRMHDMRLLREARDAAEEAVRARGMLLAHVGHELRTPLNAIAGSADLLLGAAPEGGQRELAEAVRVSAQAATAVAGALLDLTCIEAGRLRLAARDMDIRDTLAEALAIVGSAAREAGVVLSHEVAGCVPAVIHADGDRIRQVLLNLLGNAIKFARGGAVAVRIDAIAGAGDTELHVMVRDNGAGIAADDTRRLFEPFWQPDAGRRAGGAGLGLAISKCLCELMGGRIWVESIPGEGSAFHFTIRAGRAGPRHAEPCVSRATRTLDVLVVDDDALSRKIVAARLERLGHRVRTAPDGTRAIRAFRRRRHDVVLLDVEMPGMNGLEAARRIRSVAARDRARIVALTGHAGEGVRERLLAAGFDDYLCKPVDEAGLVRALHGREHAAATATPAHDETIDAAQLESLREVAPGGTLVADVARHFIREAGSMLRALRDDAARADRHGLAQRSHRVGSMALACGASRVARVCRELEESAARRALWRVPGLVERLQEEIDTACAALAPHARAA